MSSNPLNRFERLATVAAQEPAPAIDVADRVLATLASQAVSRQPDREMVVCGFASVVAATLAISVLWIESTDEALLALVQPFFTGSP